MVLEVILSDIVVMRSVQCIDEGRLDASLRFGCLLHGDGQLHRIFFHDRGEGPESVVLGPVVVLVDQDQRYVLGELCVESVLKTRHVSLFLRLCDML